MVNSAGAKSEVTLMERDTFERRPEESLARMRDAGAGLDVSAEPGPVTVVTAIT